MLPLYFTSSENTSQWITDLRPAQSHPLHVRFDSFDSLSSSSAVALPSHELAVQPHCSLLAVHAGCCGLFASGILEPFPSCSCCKGQVSCSLQLRAVPSSAWCHPALPEAKALSSRFAPWSMMQAYLVVWSDTQAYSPEWDKLILLLKPLKSHCRSCAKQPELALKPSRNGC